MVVVPKANGNVRICIDLTKLKENIFRELHPLPSVDHTLAQLAGATVFSELDVNSCFWQIGMSPESSKLTTLITPFGRFCFNHLPKPHFQKQISQVLEGTEGLACCSNSEILALPTLPIQHDSRWPYLEQFREKDATLKARQKKNFDMRHSTKRLPDLLPGDPVWIPDQKVAGTVLNKAGTPRTYTDETPKGQLRRNRCHLNSLTESLTESDSEASGVLPTCDVTSNSTVQTPIPVGPKRTTQSS